MKKQINNSGFSIVEGLLIIAILGVIGLIGYTVAMNTIYKDDLNSTINTVIKQQSTSATDVPDVKSIDNAADLKAAEDTLDSINLDETDADILQIDGQLSNF